MSDFAITAREDEDHPEGGHALIVIEGVGEIGDDLKFMLTPVKEDRQGPAYDVWHRPLSYRATDDALLLMIGPDLAEDPLFAAGDEFTLAIDGVEGDGVLIWPVVSPLVKAKRKPLLARRSWRDDDVGSDQAETQGLPVVTPELAPPVSTSVAQPSLADLSRPAPKVETPSLNDGALEPARAIAAATIGLDPALHRAADSPEVAAPTGSTAATKLLASPLAVAGLTAFLIVGAQALLLPDVFQSKATSQPQFSLPAVSKTIEPNAVFELFATGPISPRGVAVAGVSAQRALDLANQALSPASGAKDVDEAAFWLKRYLAMSPSPDRFVRTVTQLGTLHAEQGNARQPDYAKARALWEIAAALGDPNAAFFLGQLREYGLGVAVDKATALTWYERARALGSVNGVDEAIQRVRRSAG